MLQADESKTAAGSERRWCVAVDGSHAAHNAFLTCMRCYTKGDFVQVVYASEDASKGVCVRAYAAPHCTTAPASADGHLRARIPAGRPER